MYMIIGLLLILALAVGFLFNSYVFHPAQEPIPDWALPVKTEMESCMTNLGVDAIIKLAQHGGYIDMTDQQLSGRKFTFDQNDPTESDGVSLAKSSFVPVPYWFYMDTNNECISNCRVNSVLPSIAQMQREIDVYVERNINECMNGFQNFKGQGLSVIAIEQPQATTTIAEKDVQMKLTYPIEVTQNGQTITLKEYQTGIDFNLREFLSFGLRIAAYETSRQFLEGIMMNLITTHSGKEYTKLPPIGDLDHEDFAVSWDKDLVKVEMEKNILPYFNSVQIGKTKDSKKINIPNAAYAEAAYNTMYVDFLPQEFPQRKVDILYGDWPIYLNIYPANGNKIEPDIIIKKYEFLLNAIPPSRTNRYEFFYSVSWPVIVRIHEEKALRGKDIDLIFALEGNIRSNKNLQEWYTGQGLILWQYGNPEIKEGDNVPIPATSLFCEGNQRLSKNITVNVFDGATNDPIDKATVSYGCGDYATCLVGYSRVNKEKESRFSGPFPLCKGGYLMVEKPGYHPAVFDLSTTDDQEHEFTADLNKYRMFNTSIKKYEMSVKNTPMNQNLVKREVTCCNQPIDLKEGEYAIISLQKLKESDYESTFAQTITMIPGQDPLPIKLIPGKYTLTGTFFSANTYNITKECFKVCTNRGIFGCSAHKSLPEQDVQMVQFGGSIFNETTGYWELTDDMLDSGNKQIEFYVLQSVKAECLVENCEINPASFQPQCIAIDDLGKLDSYKLQYASYLKPKFS